MDKESGITGAEEPVSVGTDEPDTLAGCRRDLDTLAGLISQLVVNAGGQAQVNQRLAERLMAIERQLLSAGSSRQHFAVYVGDHVALTWALDRYKMYVDTRDKAIAVHLLTEGGWEPDVTRLLASTVKRGMKVVDVGANVGYFSLLLADRAGPDGMLWAFEPDPRNYELLSWNLDVNGFTPWSRPYQLAAFDRRTQVRFWQNPINFGGHSVLTGDSGEVGGSVIQVDAAPLDDVISAPVDVMKIDAEGSEPFIWEGMRQTVERSPNLRVLLEFDPLQIRGKGREPQDFLCRIRQDGFRIHRIRHDASLHPASDEELVHGPLVMLHLSRE